MLIQQLRLATSAINLPGLRARVLDVLKRLEREGRDAGFESGDIQQAEFALVAFIDEAIAGGSIPEKEVWSASPLQSELFGLNYAGEEFYRRLHELRQRPGSNTSLLEVYYLCLVLGFKGKYLLDNPEVLRQLVEDTKADIIRGKDARLSRQLSPHGMPQENLGGVVARDLPAWVLAASAAGLAVLVFIVMSWLISGAADRVKTLIDMAG
jgi:type VI secretion system protein ImpK